MMREFQWKKAVLLAAILAVASQARALGGHGGASGNATGGPQIVHQGGGPGEAQSMNPRGFDGVPMWYSVNGPQIVHQGGGSGEARSMNPTGLDGVPTWYHAMSGINRSQPGREPTPVEQNRPVPLAHWHAVD